MKITYDDIKIEEELKNKISKDYFSSYDCTKIIGKIDFSVSEKNSKAAHEKYFLWAEAKKGKSDIFKSLVQLILTIGKARTFDRELPPQYLGSFDAFDMALIPYNDIQEFFYMNDFNWNVAASDYSTKEFGIVESRIKDTLEKKSLIFDIEKDRADLLNFIKNNFVVNNENTTKVQIDKNNFVSIYNKWLDKVKPTITVDWDLAKKSGIIDGDFYLADLLSENNKTLKDKLYVLLKTSYYELDRRKNETGLFSSSRAEFYDNQKAHNEFWNIYERPPREEYWDYIIERRDLLVPQDVRERKGSFFTPQIWVEKSQEYLTDVLGENWQDDYYIWDCAAGTGNLLTGLTNKYNIWASTLDKQDVDVMKDRVKHGANLLEEHIFQFDFLNDSFDKLPSPLKEIIDNEEKRKKLVIYINPPYAEGDARIGKGRKGIQDSKIHKEYQKDLGKASGEMFAQFFIRIIKEINGCILAEFSKLKILQAPNFKYFRNVFQAKLKKMFVVPADTFDNVSGDFPIGFMIWNTSEKEKFTTTTTDIYDENIQYMGIKKISAFDGIQLISALIEKKKIEPANSILIGNMSSIGNDFQHQNALFIEHFGRKKIAGGRHTNITNYNLREIGVYYAIRKVIDATWLNDRDQFLYPNDGWINDTEFQNDCLTYTLFTNNIQSKFGTNHWIPFTEKEVDAKEKFESNFMTNFIAGKINQEKDLENYQATERNTPLEFSDEATQVFEVGRELWKYYHSRPNINANASLYDIREYFQGRNDKGKMNHSSDDENYNELITLLRTEIKKLAKKIEPKVYEYGFLKD